MKNMFMTLCDILWEGSSRGESGKLSGIDRGWGPWFLAALVLSGCVEVLLAPRDASALQTAVRGRVTDQEGNPLEGAKCVFTHTGQNFQVPVVSGDDGRFIRAGLPSGEYQIACELEQYAHEPFVAHIGSRAEGLLEVKMVKIQTESPHYKEGFQAFSEGRFEEAISQMELALGDDPEDDRAKYILGLSLAELGKYEDALEHFQRVASSESELAESPMLNLSIGQTYLLMGEEETAEQYFQKVDNPGEVSSMFAQAGTRAFNGGQLEKAERYFQEALEADPSNVDALFGLGLCHIRADRAEEALKTLKTILSIAPEHEKAKLAEDLVKNLEAAR